MNVAVSLEIGERMTTAFRASLPSGFHSTLSSSITTMEHRERRQNGRYNDLRPGGDVPQTVDHWAATTGGTRPIFQYKLCLRPPPLNDEYGSLRSGSKAPLVHNLREDKSDATI